MDDYIKRSDALELARTYFTPVLSEEAVPVKAIKIIPSAHVVEVKHGKWITLSPDKSSYFVCSVCEEISCCRGNYCPDCGARMDGET